MGRPKLVTMLLKYGTYKKFSQRLEIYGAKTAKKKVPKGSPKRHTVEA